MSEADLTPIWTSLVRYFGQLARHDLKDVADVRGAAIGCKPDETPVRVVTENGNVYVKDEERWVRSSKEWQQVKDEAYIWAELMDPEDSWADPHGSIIDGPGLSISPEVPNGCKCPLCGKVKP